ncbi:hypothetical protein D3C72_2461140 [compost metagenome]
MIARRSTLRLVERLGGPVQYLEVEGSHDLIIPGHAGWAELEQALQRFAWDAWHPLSGRSLSRVP